MSGGVFPSRVTSEPASEGDLLVYESGVWVPLNPGTSSYVLTSNGPGTAPTWQVGGAGAFAAYTPDNDATLASASSSRIPTQAAVKSYVDNAVSGLSWKAAVRVATTVARTLATDFENGDTIDGVTLATGDRILIKNQADPTQNGIYLVNASGAPSRAPDANAGAELVSAAVLVLAGSSNAGTGWTCANTSVTLGITSIVFSQFLGPGSYTAGTGLQLSGNQFSVDFSAVQPYSATLASLAATTPGATGLSLLGAGTAGAARSTLGLLNAGGWPASIFGNGADGAADLDGVNTYPWATLAGSTYTMTRCAYLTTLRVRAGITLVKRFIPFVNDTLTLDDPTSVVSDDGSSASGTTAGAAITSTGRLPECTTGFGGGGRNTTGAGSTGGNSSGAYGGAGGAAGVASGYTANGGSVTAPPAASDTIRGTGFMGGVYLLGSGTGLIRANGAAGGGGAGCNVGAGTASSGGGGGGAPISMLFARQIANNGVIRCNGGAGGNATATGGGVAGGGGGGGGGYLIVVSNTPLASAGTIQANGGAGGAGAGGGAAGSAGGAGTVEYRGP